MSSRSLISTLFHSQSKARISSGSVQNKTLADQMTSSQRSRSISQCKNDASLYIQKNKLIPLVRAIHTQTVKLKKHSYFFFCRLQANMKQLRKKDKQNNAEQWSANSSNIDQKLAVFESSLQNSSLDQIQPTPERAFSRFSKRSSRSNNLSPQIQLKLHVKYSKATQIEEGLHQLCDTVSLVQSKTLYFDKMTYAFKQIKARFWIKPLAAIQLSQVIKQVAGKRLKIPFDLFLTIQRLNLKLQIFQDVMHSVVSNKLKTAFDLILTARPKQPKTNRKREQFVSLHQRTAYHSKKQSLFEMVNKSKKTLLDEFMKQDCLKPISEQSSFFDQQQEEYNTYRKESNPLDFALITAQLSELRPFTRTIRLPSHVKKTPTSELSQQCLQHCFNCAKSPKSSYKKVSVSNQKLFIQKIKAETIIHRDFEQQAYTMQTAPSEESEKGECMTKLQHLFSEPQTIEIPDTNLPFEDLLKTLRLISVQRFVKTDCFNGEDQSTEAKPIQIDQSSIKLDVFNQTTSFKSRTIGRQYSSQFFSTSHPFSRIEDMMKDLQRIRDRQNHDHSQRTSVTKFSSSHSREKKPQQEATIRKNYKEKARVQSYIGAQRRKSVIQKENLITQSRLWHQKEKLLFYPQKNRVQSKKSKRPLSEAFMAQDNLEKRLNLTFTRNIK